MTDAAAPGESDGTVLGGRAGPPSRPGNASPAPRRHPCARLPASGRFRGGDPAASGIVPYASRGLRLGGYLIHFVISLLVLSGLFLLFRHSHTLDVRTIGGRRGPAALPRCPSSSPACSIRVRTLLV